MDPTERTIQDNFGTQLYSARSPKTLVMLLPSLRTLQDKTKPFKRLQFAYALHVNFCSVITT